MGRTFQSRHRFISVTLGLLLSISVGSFALWKISDLRLLSVESNSMVPVLRAGDAVTVRPVDINSISPGDIVSYRDAAHPSLLITHRVILIDRLHELVTTKGDNAPQIDRPINQQLLLGRVSYAIPRLGFALNFLRSPAGLIVGTYIPALLMVGLEIRNLTNAYRKSRYRLLASTR